MGRSLMSVTGHLPGKQHGFDVEAVPDLVNDVRKGGAVNYNDHGGDELRCEERISIGKYRRSFEA